MSTVIKSEEYGRVSGLSRPFHLQDIEREAAEIVASARAQASSIAQQALAEGRRLKTRAMEEGLREGRVRGEREGRDAGYAAGMATGRKEALQEFREKQDTLVEMLTKALRAFDENRRHYLARAESDLVDLMLAVSRRVVKRIGMIDREAAIENLREAIRQVSRRSRVVVRVSPADLENVRVFAEELHKAEQGSEHVRVMADERIAPGGCVIALGDGEVDATLDVQLDHVAALLVGGDQRG